MDDSSHDSVTKTTSSLDYVDNKKIVDDDRIECSNSRHLDNILDVAVRHVTVLAESHLTESKNQFISRFKEVFKNTIEENVTVNGLPWVINKDNLSIDEKQEQNQETADALLSKLSNTLENTAHKRKHFPKQCCRVYSKQLMCERQNLKKAKIEHSTLLSTISFPRPPYSDKTNELSSVCEKINLAQRQIQAQVEALHQIQKKSEIAHNIVKEQKPHLEHLYDTGYISD
ncbi:uncharacterized protein NPIL_33021 [Nephila pilipes]|uniref:Uncharacterized protein n=1 Tax=Nephila pilipes TaxID=299642 RepID=A0A8X6TFY1_NEPPI|nr:uncharacterized protein NPIL_33021 [Nephila pilipes]